MNKNFIIGIIVLAVAVGGGFIFSKSQKNTAESPAQMSKTANDVGQKQMTNQTGKILAGSKSPYYEFSKADYQAALQSGKIVFLDFYANWCPICRAEAPELKAGFDALMTDKAVGFRVNYNDSDTDADEKALAKEFGITYQHQKRIIKNGKVVLQSSDSWDKERFLREINTLAGS